MSNEIYKKILETLESVESGKTEMSKELAQSLHADVKQNQSLSNDEAKTYRESRDEMKTEMSGIKDMLSVFSEKLGLDMNGDVKEQLSDYQKSQQAELDKNKSESQVAEERLLSFEKEINGQKSTITELQNTIIKKERDAIRETAKSQILQGWTDAKGLESVSIRDMAINALLGRGSYNDDNVFTIDGADPREFTTQFIKNDPSLQQSMIKPQPPADPSASQYANVQKGTAKETAMGQLIASRTQ